MLHQLPFLQLTSLSLGRSSEFWGLLIVASLQSGVSLGLMCSHSPRLTCGYADTILFCTCVRRNVSRKANLVLTPLSPSIGRHFFVCPRWWWRYCSLVGRSKNDQPGRSHTLHLIPRAYKHDNRVAMLCLEASFSNLVRIPHVIYFCLPMSLNYLQHQLSLSSIQHAPSNTSCVTIRTPPSLVEMSSAKKKERKQILQSADK